MEPQNPYQPPSADVAAQSISNTDQTSSFSPAGRFGRLSYIAWTSIFNVVYQVATGALGGTDRLKLAPGADVGADVVAIIVIFIAFLVCFTLFSIRRCHDINDSGWWMLVGLIPLVNLVFLLYICAKQGDQGPNKYGPPRVTRGWERVVGFIGVALIVVGLVGIIVVIAIPALKG